MELITTLTLIGSIEAGAAINGVLSVVFGLMFAAVILVSIIKSILHVFIPLLLNGRPLASLLMTAVMIVALTVQSVCLVLMKATDLVIFNNR